MTWADVAAAGAFVLGAFAGTLATIRVMRVMSDRFKHDRDGPGS